MESSQPKPDRDATDRKYTMLGLRIVGEFGAIIAVPIIALSLIGKWLDGKYGTEPRYLIIGFALAIVFSAVSIVKKAKRFAKEYQEIEKEKNKK